MTIRLLLVDDHEVVRSGLRMLLEDVEDIEIIGEAANGEDALRQAEATSPDVMVLDIGLPDRSGIEVAREVKRLHPEIAIVALTIHEDEEFFFEMLHAGSSGYVPKRAAPDELLDAVRCAARGDVYLYPSLAKVLVRDFLDARRTSPDEEVLRDLTEREREVLALLADGESHQNIAGALHISPKTVARHRENIMRKLDLHSRTELVKYAIRRRIITP